MRGVLGRLLRRGRDEEPFEVVFYTKPDCSLCVQAERLLQRLRRRYPLRVVKVNILESPPLLARYGDKIPLLKIDGGNQLALRINEERLRRALERARLRRAERARHVEGRSPGARV